MAWETQVPVRPRVTVKAMAGVKGFTFVEQKASNRYFPEVAVAGVRRRL